MANSLWLTILPSVLSGLLGVIISTYYYRRNEKRKLKQDTLRKLLAYRHVGVPGSTEMARESFFAALNDVFAVFHDSREVIQALQTLHAELKRPERLRDHLIRLFKRIFKDLSIDLEGVNDSFFLHPFVDGPGLAGSPAA